MNVLITAPSLNEYENVSGISSVVRSIVNYPGAAHRYFHFRVGTKDGDKKGLGWAMTQLTLLPRLLRFVKQHDIDLIHLNTDFTKASILRDYFLLGFIGKIKGLKVIMHIHGGKLLMQPPAKNSLFRYLIKGMLNRADGTIVLTKSEQNMLSELYRAKTIVLPNAIANPEEGDYRVKEFAQKKIKFAFLGKIVTTKGVLVIAKALHAMAGYFDSFTILFYGAGPDLTLLLSHLQSIDQLKFEYRGVVRGKSKWDALEEADVFLLPSYGEGLPMALLEAMQAGCVPVVSNDSSFLTIINEGENGFLSRKGDSEDLTTVLKYVIDHKITLGKISSAAIKTVKDHYSLPNYMVNLGTAYASIM